MALNLFVITVFGLFWGALILIAYKVGVSDGKEIYKLYARRKASKNPSNKDRLEHLKKEIWEKDAGEGEGVGCSTGEVEAESEDYFKEVKEVQAGVYPKEVTEGEAGGTKSQRRLNAILYNIDNYNGTDLGQKEV